MTRPELIRWANAPEQKENVVAEAVLELLREFEAFGTEKKKLRASLENALAACRNYDAECVRLRKAALPQAPWESEDVPL